MQQPVRDDRAQPSVVPRIIWLAALLAGVLMILQDATHLYMASGQAHRGTTGVWLAGNGNCHADRFCPVDRLLPDGPAARAGVTTQDLVRLDRYWEAYRVVDVGENVGMTVRDRDGNERHLILTATDKTFLAPTYVVAGSAQIAICLVALLLIGRAGRRGWVLLLGLALITYGTPGNYPRIWENAHALFVPFLILLSTAIAVGPPLMLAALRGFRRDIIGHSPRWLDGLIWATAMGELLCLIWGLAIVLDSRPLLGVGNGLALLSLGWSAGTVLAPLVLTSGWRHVPAPERTRYAFMWLAVGVFSVNALIDPVIMLTGNDYVAASWPVLLQLASMILGTVLFAYASLRHRVVDLGFAINRTLVFSASSFLLLLTFGVVEWASEKLLPIEHHEANAIIEALVAVGIFLIFHRVHEWVERAVERLFFHKWRVNAEALSRFVRQAAYITRPETLMERTVTELQRFSGQSDVALYRPGNDGYLLQAGSHDQLPARLDADAAPLVAMRAERLPIRDAFLPGTLLLPMLHRTDVLAFVVIGAKPNGEPYRPDEESELATAIHQIGLDLHALRVEELERENARLAARIGITA